VGQGAQDYNDYMSASLPCWNGSYYDEYPAGCGTIATAQVIKYLENYSSSDYPDGYVTTTLKGFIQFVAAGVNTHFDCGGSWCLSCSVVSFLNNLYGYTANRSSFVPSTVDNELLAHRPVIANAFSDALCLTSGHLWVIDGLDTWVQYRCDMNPWTHELFETQVATYEDYSMNWGWGGADNGWFAFDDWESYTHCKHIITIHP